MTSPNSEPLLMIVGNGVFSYFENSKVEFCRRQANVVAHNLAREATFLASPHDFNVIPSCIGSLI
jgi:hypothetical protein